MKRLSWVLAAVLAGATPSPALAKKKKPAPSGTVKKDGDKPPPPGDKGTNEGAQGRKNATEDAARSADSPQFERRP